MHALSAEEKAASPGRIQSRFGFQLALDREPDFGLRERAMQVQMEVPQETCISPFAWMSIRFSSGTATISKFSFHDLCGSGAVRDPSPNAATVRARRLARAFPQRWQHTAVYGRRP